MADFCILWLLKKPCLKYHVIPFVAEAHIPMVQVAVCFYIRGCIGY